MNALGQRSLSAFVNAKVRKGWGLVSIFSREHHLGIWVLHTAPKCRLFKMFSQDSVFSFKDCFWINSSKSFYHDKFGFHLIWLAASKRSPF